MDLTVTDKNDVAFMKDADIRKWISLHQRSLKNNTMKEHWEDVQEDLNVLKAEWELRNPLMNVLGEICTIMRSIDSQLKKLLKEKQDGTTKD